jgi:hypothetical protein
MHRLRETIPVVRDGVRPSRGSHAQGRCDPRISSLTRARLPVPTTRGPSVNLFARTAIRSARTNAPSPPVGGSSMPDKKPDRYQAPAEAFQTLGQFPHCDPNVLHAPSICEYCDAQPRVASAPPSVGNQLHERRRPPKKPRAPQRATARHTRSTGGTAIARRKARPTPMSLFNRRPRGSTWSATKRKSKLRGCDRSALEGAPCLPQGPREDQRSVGGRELASTTRSPPMNGSV